MKLARKMYLHPNMWSEPGKMATPYDPPCARARNLVPFPDYKCGPLLLGLPARVLTDAGIGGLKGAVIGGHKNILGLTAEPAQRDAGRACGAPSSGLVPLFWSNVSGPQAKPNDSVLAEAVMLSMRRRVYLQIMTWFSLYCLV